MLEGGNFNITNTLKPTNNDLVVVFSPAQNITSYTYFIYKDNQIIESKNITKNEEATINLTKTGKYQIKVNALNTENKVLHIASGIYTIDKEAPVIKVNQNNIQINKNKDLPNDIVRAEDNYSGDLTNNITSNIKEINLNSVGTKTLTYTVSDEAGNIAKENININVINSQNYLYVMQILTLVAILSIIFVLTRIKKALKISKRIEPFTIDSNQNIAPSISDRIVSWYQSNLEKLTPSLEKTVVATKYGKLLNKYASVSSIHKTGTEIFISKIFVSLIFVSLALFAKTVQFKMITSYELALPFLVGFFLLDLVYLIKYKAYKSKLENDLLSAIIIMNNAFKSGRSITQAIDVVSKEMKGRMAKEFVKMSLELSYGLEIDTVFKRFSDRIKLPEVNYLTASLSILNKTGGNIIEVFSSIEKTMFNKKKLKLELKSLTASSKIIVYVLFIVPFLFILFVSLISPEYFMPFINTHLGRILLAFMLIYYLLFIYFVRKIMKVVI